MKVKTSEAKDQVLDYLVAKCEGVSANFLVANQYGGEHFYQYSNNWLSGGPIIEREEIAMWPDEEGGFFASANEGAGKDYHGKTYLIAAMRCYVASKLGDEVEIPEELK